MPVPTRVQPEKNIWIAAGDGDLDRVRELIEQQSLSPNVPDENTYTPMHAAASYGQIHVLEYLISKGGNVNVTDGDDDTPLYVVENIETARWLVEHGAIVQRINHEGLSPAAYLTEDSPDVAAYLESLSPSQTLTQPQPTELSNSTEPSLSSVPSSALPSQHAQNQATEHLTSELMEQVQQIMERAEAEGRDPEEELRQVVGRTVLEGVITGYGMGTMNDGANGDGGDAKRVRRDGDA